MSQASVDRDRWRTTNAAREYLENLAKPARKQGIAVGTAVIEGRPNSDILSFAESQKVDLIVICSRGDSGLSRWLMGSVADRVVRGAKIPVLLVRAEQETREPQTVSGIALAARSAEARPAEDGVQNE